MSKNNLTTLNEHIFDALEKLSKAKNADEVKAEVQRCNAITNAGRTIVEELKIGVEISKLQDKGNEFAEGVPALLGLEDEE